MEVLQACGWMERPQLGRTGTLKGGQGPQERNSEKWRGKAKREERREQGRRKGNKFRVLGILRPQRWGQIPRYRGTETQRDRGHSAHQGIHEEHPPFQRVPTLWPPPSSARPAPLGGNDFQTSPGSPSFPPSLCAPESASASASALSVLPAFDLVENFHLGMGLVKRERPTEKYTGKYLAKKRGEGMWKEL